MRRVLAVTFVLGLVSMAMGDVVVFEPVSEAPKFNPAYDNLYRPGNPIWALRQQMLAERALGYAEEGYGLLSTSSQSTATSEEVARPLEAFNAENARAYTVRYYRMSDLMKALQPANAEEESSNPVFLGVRPTTQPAPEPNRHIVIEQINPKGTDNNPARAGEVIIKKYEAPAKARPVR